MREPDGSSAPQGPNAPLPDQSPADLRSRLDALKADLGEAVAEDREASGASGKHASGGELAAGLRAATELVAGVLVGGAIGFFLDRQIGTKPLFLVVFLIMGMGAGFLNLYRLGQRRPDGNGGRSGQGD
ncbi:AtpZ/AtpI family protein [Rhabdaerophilum calidifontis]|jgi:ATP synthase protein I|uniref:AtpZ/AtpI family protein n=1 Tax=Rhabdaerophilum calidifontis TaxID=2604328 RepID=UPI00123A5D3D|nr:AtpZ/AtpI family protein [Rhabdaerophilum calidifontis]